ncbi:Ankyrin repeat and BTB/POZ domain-containing protein 1 [Pleodorina starrii]|nr:Ankyrin repeat and BTB/POZ domain-containing protein 1 [Pleodorina starrii]
MDPDHRPLKITAVSGGGGGGATGGGGRLPGRRREPSAALAELHCALCASCPSLEGCAASGDSSSGSGGGGGGATASGAAIVTYFRRLLDPAGGFADSGEAEVSLAEADPEAFGWLLAYMYTGELHMPYELLRPAADLAGRLLLPAECAADLQARLLAAVVTPGR